MLLSLSNQIHPFHSFLTTFMDIRYPVSYELKVVGMMFDRVGSVSVSKDVSLLELLGEVFYHNFLPCNKSIPSCA